MTLASAHGPPSLLTQCATAACVSAAAAATGAAGTVSCFIMERFAPGVNFMLSAELDHAAKNYKFGFGFTAGE
jgi:hypothetical protein